VTQPVITLLTDYGLADEFVGVCHGVIARICPEARVIDVSHGVPRHDARTGGLMLAQALPYLPVGVHVAIVDPDVGGRRRAIALSAADGHTFVGPDNGVLWPAAQIGGQITEAVEISHSPLRLEPVSATFHGRDIFCPVAAHLAAGTPLQEAGPPLDPDELVRLDVPQARLENGRLLAEVTLVDRFGNLQLSARHEDLEAAGLRLGREAEIWAPSADPQVARYVRTFAEAGRGELILYEDAGRRLAVAVSHGSAAERLGAGPGATVTLSAGAADRTNTQP
jgi:S-adenosylmethionine hydrolase